MNEQGRRKERLFHLRAQQHAFAELHLRTAQLDLRHHEDALLATQTHLQAIRRCEHDALQSGTAKDWMLACAEAEAARQLAAQHSSNRDAAAQKVAEAANAEQAARVTSKQMEHLVNEARLLRSRKADHDEQLRLDEIARNLRAFSQRDPFRTRAV